MMGSRRKPVAGKLLAVTALLLWPSIVISQVPSKTGEAVREQVRTTLRDVGRIVSPNGIDESRYVDLGGFRQWIGIRGQDKSLPILLFLHGGPGSPISSIAYSYQRPWEDFFTVVQWDQRGFGRSAGTAADTARLKGTLNRLQYRKDAIELIEKLRYEFGQKKIILVGQSWGTVLALELAASRPDLFHVVVTQGLAANWMESPRLLLRHLIAKAQTEGNQAEIKRLREVGPLPDLSDAPALMAWARKLGVGFPDANTWHNIKGAGDSWQRRIDTLEYVSPDYDAEAYRASKSLQAADPAGSAARYQEAMASVLPWDADRDVGARFRVPIVVMQGSHDWQTDRDPAKAYFDRLCAPWKKWVEFPHSAHALNIEQPGLSIVSLVNDVLPAVHGKVPTGAQPCIRADTKPGKQR